MPRTALMATIVLALSTAVLGNPPPAAEFEDDFRMAFTVEPAVHLEYPNDSLAGFSTILYGGPFGMYTSGSDFSSFGFGLSAGCELRQYTTEVARGFFAGLYGGFGVQWYRDAGSTKRESAFSLGPKLGYRVPLVGSLDAEPYVALGVYYPEFHPAGYLGLKLDIR